jgi:hypothetical protein
VPHAPAVVPAGEACRHSTPGCGISSPPFAAGFIHIAAAGIPFQLQCRPVGRRMRPAVQVLYCCCGTFLERLSPQPFIGQPTSDLRVPQPWRATSLPPLPCELGSGALATPGPSLVVVCLGYRVASQSSRMVQHQLQSTQPATGPGAGLWLRAGGWGAGAWLYGCADSELSLQPACCRCCRTALAVGTMSTASALMTHSASMCVLLVVMVTHHLGASCHDVVCGCSMAGSLGCRAPCWQRPGCSRSRLSTAEQYRGIAGQLAVAPLSERSRSSRKRTAGLRQGSSPPGGSICRICTSHLYVCDMHQSATHMMWTCTLPYIAGVVNSTPLLELSLGEAHTTSWPWNDVAAVACL